MQMICGNCKKTGIRWMGPMSRLTHTECPHCGGQNCQIDGDSEEDDPEIETCGCGATGEVNYDDGMDRRYYCHGALPMCSP